MSRRSRWWRAVALAAAVGVLGTGAACSGGGDDEAGRSDEREQEDRDRDGAAQAPATTAEPREEPPGTEPDEVRPYIEELLRRFDEVTAQIMADPDVARNRDHSLYGELRELLTPDSAMAEPLVTTLMEQGLQGMVQRPYDDSGPPISRELYGDISGASENDVSFQLCANPHYRLFDGSGQQIEISTGPSLLNRGQASRVEGRWLLSRIDSLNDRETCEETSR